MATHSSFLAWRILWTEEAGRVQSVGSQNILMTGNLAQMCLHNGIGPLYLEKSGKIVLMHQCQFPNFQGCPWQLKIVVVQSLRHVRFFGPHGLQHVRLRCPSLSPGVCSNSCPLSWWCHPTISSSVSAFSSCPQTFPASGFFPMSHLFTSGDQSTECMAHRTLLNGSTKANYFNCTVSSLLTNKFPSESMSVSPICS